MNERRHGNDLTGRRGGYDELKRELRHFFKKIWVFVLVIGLTSIVGLAGFGYILSEAKKDAIERCTNQNARHDNAIYALIAGSNEDQLNTKDTIADEEIRRRRDVTIGLIDAIAPKTDCENPAPVKALPKVTPIPEDTP